MLPESSSVFKTLSGLVAQTTWIGLWAMIKYFSTGQNHPWTNYSPKKNLAKMDQLLAHLQDLTDNRWSQLITLQLVRLYARHELDKS